MTQPPVRRPQGSYPPVAGYGPPRNGYGPPAGGYGPPHALRQGPPPGGRQGPLRGPHLSPPQGPPPRGFLPSASQGVPPSPPRKGSAGKIGAIVVVALLVLGVGGFALWKTFGGASSGGDPTAGSNGSDVSAGTEGASSSCSLVATQDVAAVFGGEGWTVLDSGPSVLKAYDSRVLAGVPTSCVATDSLNSKLARIARYQGSDAAARFAEEKQKASRGDDGPYLGKDVQAGDEAFCTTGSKTITAGSSAGALVRHGDTLVYVSTTAAGEGADANCDLSLKLIEKVHAP